MWIDVGKLIRERVPDKNGEFLPADLTSGSYEFRDLTDFAVGALFEGKVIYDKTYGHVAYGCANCCGTMSTQLWFNPLGVAFSGTAGQGVNGYDNCALAWTDISNYFNGNWLTANTAVATVNSYGMHTGVSVGSTTSSTWSNLREGSNGLYCPRLKFSPQGGANVQVRVPTKVLPIATQNQGTIMCAGGQGWYRTVTNQLQDQFGSAYAHAGIAMADTITFGTNQLGLSPVTGSASTDANGTWADFYSVCSSLCPSSGQSVAAQSWTYSGIPLPHVNSVVYKCSSITIDGY